MSENSGGNGCEIFKFALRPELKPGSILIIRSIIFNCEIVLCQFGGAGVNGNTGAGSGMSTCFQESIVQIQSGICFIRKMNRALFFDKNVENFEVFVKMIRLVSMKLGRNEIKKMEEN